LDWGASISTITAAASAAGMPLSQLPCVQTRVDLFEYLRPEWDAFWSLSTDRPVGMSQGPIPWSSIDRYAMRYAIEGDEFDRFHDLIRALDVAFLSYKKEG
jgi:hypothetical protein